MSGFIDGQSRESYSFSNGLLDNSEFRSLYESFLNTNPAEELLASCPVIGVQTQAETTSKTGSLRPDGVSSLPLNYSLDVDVVGLQSPLETTVLDSSSPLDGISVSNLLYAVVKLTSNALSPEHSKYSGETGVIVEVDEQALQVCVEVKFSSTRIVVSNFRNLSLSTPMVGDSVRCIRGESAGATGTVSSQRDDSQAVVAMTDGTSQVVPLNDLVRLDSTALQHDSSSSPPYLVREDSWNMSTQSPSTSKQQQQHSPSFSSWRVNSPVPPSPMDSIVPNCDTSPSSSLIGNVTSPGNPWSVSSSSSTTGTTSEIPDLAFCLSSDSSASSSNISAASMHRMTSHSLPNTLATAANERGLSSFVGNETRYQNNSLPASQFERSTAAIKESLPGYTRPYTNDTSTTSPATSPTATSTAAGGGGNLYPVLTGDSLSTNGSLYATQSANGYSCQGTGLVGVSYPVLPSYSSALPHCNNQQTTPPMATCNISLGHQLQYMPVMLGNGYAYGYQPQQHQYQQIGVIGTNQTRPSAYLNQSTTTSASLYPQLPGSATPTSHYCRTQAASLARQTARLQQAMYRNSKIKGVQLDPRKKTQCGLYPQLPNGVAGNGVTVDMNKTLSPWDEFRRLVSSTQSSLSSKKRSLEVVIDTAIAELCKKEPPLQWYNPLTNSEDSCCEISTESVRVSALCPLIKQRMDFPCRGLECTHIQCFDAKAFLKLALKRRSQLVSNLRGSAQSASNHPDNGWKCPMCGKVVSVNLLYIERYLQEAIKTYDAVELEFKGAGVWVPYEKCQEASNNSVIDLTMSDSDEDM